MIVAVGILNSGKTFPIAFSFCPGESHDYYAFFWDSLKLHLSRGVISSVVVISDQAKAILSATTQYFPLARH